MHDEQRRLGGRPKLAPEVVEERIEFVRRLLREGRSRSEVRRMFRAAFQLASKRIFGQCLTVAVKRDREVLRKNRAERLAETVGFWARIIEGAEATINRCRREDGGYEQWGASGMERVAGNFERAGEAERILRDKTASKEGIAEARKEYEFVQARIAANHRMVQATIKSAMHARRELDRILGMREPAAGLMDGSGRDGRRGAWERKDAGMSREEIAAMSDEELHAAMRRLGVQPLRFASTGAGAEWPGADARANQVKEAAGEEDAKEGPGAIGNQTGIAGEAEEMQN